MAPSENQSSQTCLEQYMGTSLARVHVCSPDNFFPFSGRVQGAVFMLWLLDWDDLAEGCGIDTAVTEMA